MAAALASAGASGGGGCIFWAASAVLSLLDAACVRTSARSLVLGETNALIAAATSGAHVAQYLKKLAS